MFNLLVVDDDKNICALFREVFQDDCDNVFTATNISEGMEVLKNHTIQTVVTDLRIGPESGRDFIHKVQNEIKDIPPILVFSGFIPEFQSELEEVGGETLRFGLDKSMDLDSLKEVVLSSLKMGKRKFDEAA